MSSTTTTGIILNLIAFVLSLLATLTALSVFLSILLQRRFRQNLDIFLCGTTFFATSMFSLLLFSLTVSVLKLDFDAELDGDSAMCRFRAYIMCVVGSASFNGYCLQAASRLIHVVYRQHLWIRTFKVYLFAVIFSWALACILMSPYLIIDNFLSFTPSENYCMIPYTNIPAMIYVVLPAFIIQLGFISLVYLRLAVFLRHTVVQNAHREFAVVKRILYTVLTMGNITVTNTVFWIIYLCTGYLHPMTYRMAVLFLSIGILMMNVTVIFNNPRLRTLVFARKRRVAPLHPLAVVPIRQ